MKLLLATERLGQSNYVLLTEWTGWCCISASQLFHMEMMRKRLLMYMRICLLSNL